VRLYNVVEEAEQSNSLPTSIPEEHLATSYQDGEKPSSADGPISFQDIVPMQWVVERLQELDLTVPTPVQAQALPKVFQGHDVVVKAETGSGKTLVFGLPFLAHVRNAFSDEQTIGLVLTPTRELALQIVSVLKGFCPDLDPVAVIGGVGLKEQFKALDNDPRLVVGTPGRVLDLIRQGRLDLSSVTFFALDEADEMLSIGFYEEVERILENIPREAQGVFVSATISPRVELLAGRFLKRAEIIVVEVVQSTTGGGINHFSCLVGPGLMDKARKVIELLEKLKPRSALVFCNTKSDTELVETILRRQSFNAERLNSDLNQTQRTDIMDRLRAQKLNILIATDLAARGIDVAQIDLVINYSLPETAETYVHRTGRTGRAGRSGIAITILPPMDFPRFHEIRKSLSMELLDFAERV
jgi:ATP-dependent RNA helicase DeaD